MTDLISSLADQLVALNNASPRLPTKQQIEDVLREHFKLLREAVDAGMLASYPVFIKPMEVKWSAPYDFTSWAPNPDEGSADLNEASLEAAISRIQGFKTEAELDRIGKELISAIEEDNKAKDEWDAQERAAHKLLGYSGSTTKERLEAERAECDRKEHIEPMRIIRGATKP